MVAPKKQGFANDDKLEGSGPRDRLTGGDSPSAIHGSASSDGRRGAEGLTERIRGILRDESGGDLLIVGRREVENELMQWLRALDLHVLGGCRADERLKPLLKFDISNGVAEDMLLTHLTQHFDVSEVGMLARCLCVPLVSIRVGKVNKQGTLLCPSATRGHLNLTLLPSSKMRLSFTGDDGITERLATLSSNFDSSEVAIEDISADSSGRSFLLKVLGSKVVYFWCSEKSKLHGKELLAKMKDLVQRKPTLFHLTGICQLRLESFATHLRAYLLRSSNSAEIDPISPPSGCPTTPAADNMHSPPLVLKSSLQECLPPRPNTLRNGIISSSSSLRSGIGGRFSRHEDNDNPCIFDSGLPITPTSLRSQTTGRCEDDRTKSHDGYDMSPLAPQLEMPCISTSLPSSIQLLLNLPPPQISASKSMFSPYYCWCPPCPSSHQYSVTSDLALPNTYDESIPLPPLSSLLLSRPMDPPVSSNLPYDVPKLPMLNLPSLLSEPVVQIPLPVTSLVNLPASQQIPTFTPFMSDPIVHTPVIDVCSSGQGYFVSAGPMISSVPPLLSGFVNHPLIPSTESAVEKSARETLRLLMASTPVFTCQKSMNIFPPALDRMDGDFSNALESTCYDLDLHKGSRNFEKLALSLPSSVDKLVGGSFESCEMQTSNKGEYFKPSLTNTEGCDSQGGSLPDSHDESS